MRIKVKRPSPSRRDPKLVRPLYRTLNGPKFQSFRAITHLSSPPLRESIVYHLFQAAAQKEFADSLTNCTDEELLTKLQALTEWPFGEQVRAPV
jgi:hypothetical protein